MPWWGAVLTALALTAVGALFDELTNKTLGLPFQVLYTIGCVLAVTFVCRRSLFGPMVQPPLIMIVVAGVVLVLFAGGGSGGLAAKAIAVGPPLIGNFPVMAIATVLTVVIGAIRLILQRKPKVDEDEDFPPAARSVRREPPSRDDRDLGRDREPPRRDQGPRPAGARTRPAPPPPGRGERPDRERMDRDRQPPPPPPRQTPPGRGATPGRPAPGAGGQRGVPPRPAAPGRGAGGRPGGGGQGRPPQPPPRRPRRPDDDY
ncbi:DUF6542 domain-containing protein [Kutzneria sp. CA-103260]|uniref:DUF6542 domain-containing protein n=1 Tax=Kutzneria sp. CA-103260 TaxID=2802641 RepID=UPI001BEDDEC3|nr:hypothetical protein JJ691_68880 [Kutzneria sp. CA-103260]